MSDFINPVALAVASLNCSQSELARRIGVKPGLVHMWRLRGSIPAPHLKKVCQVTGLPPHLLNPNIPAYFAGGVVDTAKEDNHD